jgi:hypothetical protein
VFSVFLFSALLAGLLFASSRFLLPRFTTVEIDGQTRDLSSLRDTHKNITAQIVEAEGKRRQFLLPVSDARYRALVSSKDAGPQFLDVFAEVQAIADRFPGEGGPSIIFESMTMRKDSRMLELKGEVRNVDSRSMTVLAQFTEALNTLNAAQSVATPTFTREFREAHGFFSPFTIRIVLK